MFSVYRKSEFSNSKIVSEIITIVSIFILFEDERAWNLIDKPQHANSPSQTGKGDRFAVDRVDYQQLKAGLLVFLEQREV